MKLDEILNKALPFEVTKDTSNRYIVNFVAGNRTIEFQADNESDWYEEDEGVDSGESSWTISFGEKRVGERGEAIDYDYGKTKGGKEFEVFATLKAILKKFIKEKNPTAIRFTADKDDDKDNRARLYARMFKKNLPPGWKLDVSHDEGDEHMGPMTFFMMNRK